MLVCRQANHSRILVAAECRRIPTQDQRSTSDMSENPPPKIADGAAAKAPASAPGLMEVDLFTPKPAEARIAFCQSVWTGYLRQKSCYKSSKHVDFLFLRA